MFIISPKELATLPGPKTTVATDTNAALVSRMLISGPCGPVEIIPSGTSIAIAADADIQAYYRFLLTAMSRSFGPDSIADHSCRLPSELRTGLLHVTFPWLGTANRGAIRRSLDTFVRRTWELWRRRGHGVRGPVYGDVSERLSCRAFCHGCEAGHNAAGEFICEEDCEPYQVHVYETVTAERRYDYTALWTVWRSIMGVDVSSEGDGPSSSLAELHVPPALAPSMGSAQA